jgi:predicted alpha-1,6-mannanase (GH76 family)
MKTKECEFIAMPGRSWTVAYQQGYSTIAWCKTHNCPMTPKNTLFGSAGGDDGCMFGRLDRYVNDLISRIPQEPADRGPRE